MARIRLNKGIITKVIENAGDGKNIVNIAYTAGTSYETAKRILRSLSLAKTINSHEEYISLVPKYFTEQIAETVWQYVHGSESAEDEQQSQEQLAICNIDLSEVVQLLTKVNQQQKVFESTIFSINKAVNAMNAMLERIESELR